MDQLLGLHVTCNLHITRSVLQQATHLALRTCTHTHTICSLMSPTHLGAHGSYVVPTLKVSQCNVVPASMAHLFVEPGLSLYSNVI